MTSRFTGIILALILLAFTVPCTAHAQSARFRIGVGVDTSKVTDSSTSSGWYVSGSSEASFRFGLSYDVYRPATQSLTGLIYWDTNINLSQSFSGIGVAIRTRDLTHHDSPYAGIGLGLYGPIGGAGGKIFAGYETRSNFFLEANVTLIGSADNYTPRPAFVVGVGF